jgi:hypothetical protein
MMMKKGKGMAKKAMGKMARGKKMAKGKKKGMMY